MMATNVGDLNIRLGMSTDRLDSNINSAISSVNVLDTKLKQTTILAGDATTPFFGPKSAQALQQVGFGIQDFSSQFMNAKNTADGLGRGIGAVANNAAMLGAAFGPTGMAVTAIGAAVAGIALPAMIKWVYQADSLKEKMEAAREEARDYADELRKAGEIQDAKLAGLPGMTTKEFEGIRAERMRTARSDIEQTEKELAAQTQLIEREQRKRDAAVGSSAWGPVAGMFTGKSDAQAAAEAKREELRAQLKEQQGYFTQLDQVSGETTKKLADNDFAARQKERENREKAARERIQDHEDQMRDEKAFDDWVKDNKRAVIDDEIRANDEKISALQDKRDALGDVENPNGPTSMSIRGTGAAASAINRSLAGTRSVESDTKRQIKLLEDQLSELRKANEKAGLRKRDITA